MILHTVQSDVERRRHSQNTAATKVVKFTNVLVANLLLVQ